jgi:hypothetical protein
MRPRLTYANVIATLALFIAIGGASAYGASQLGKNSVGGKQLKKNAVTTTKIKKEAVTAAKVKKGTLTGAQINLASLGVVPNASHASVADLATHASAADSAGSVPAPAVHVVGAPGEPGFQGGTHNVGTIEGISLPGASFMKTLDNIVQLEGIIEIPEGATLPVAYQLPPGFRPPAGQLVLMEQNETTVIVAGSNVVLEGHDISGDVLTNSGESDILTGFSFFAGS